jgi:NAD(P)-dependent dehydrogenase (short-subunit alcohol dehydrogenase family)
MPTIFITGSSTGLGKATAKLFAANGWKVIATMRNPEKETELQNLPNVHLLPLDVCNPEQIKSTAAQALALGEVDVVFNNAGYGLVGALEGISDAQLTRQIDTNLLGVIRVTQAIGGLVTFPFNSVYHATKWALEGWSESMAFELNKFGIGIKTVSPGGIQTDFINRSLDMGQHEAYEALTNQVFSVFANPDRALHYSTAEQIAAVVYEAATDGKDKLRYLAGQDAQASYAQRLQVGDEAFRKGIDNLFFGKQ